MSFEIRVRLKKPSRPFQRCQRDVAKVAEYPPNLSRLVAVIDNQVFFFDLVVAHRAPEALLGKHLDNLFMRHTISPFVVVVSGLGLNMVTIFFVPCCVGLGFTILVKAAPVSSPLPVTYLAVGIYRPCLPHWKLR